MTLASSFAPPPGGVKSIQSKLPVADADSLLVIHCPTVIPANGLPALPPGSLHTPIGTAQLLCEGINVATAAALTSLAPAPRSCINQGVTPFRRAIHIA